MLVAKSTGDPQLSDDAERVHGFVRTIRPIAQVCVENFLVTLAVGDASLDGDLWHVSLESIALTPVPCFERSTSLHASLSTGARSAPKKPTKQLSYGSAHRRRASCCSSRQVRVAVYCEISWSSRSQGHG